MPFFIQSMKQVECKVDAFIDYLFIDDGSTDDSLRIMKELSQTYKNVKYVSFSRNFGKEAAMYAGLCHAKGNYIVIMDVDLQDPPELIVTMYNEVTSGEYDCVATRRVTRKGEPPIRSFFARCFYKTINKISEIQIVDGARDFRLMSRNYADALLQMNEYNRFSKGLFSWIGFKTKWIEYENVERIAGEAKWSFYKLIKYSIEGIVAFSTAPLLLSFVVGFSSCFIAALMAIYHMVKVTVWDYPVAGFPTLVCLLLMFGGIQLVFMGVIGQYLSKMHIEIQRRPIYICKESNIGNNFND